MTSSEFFKALHNALLSYECDNPMRIEAGDRVLLIGNGGSAAIASHIANDLLVQGYSAMTLTDAPTLTCLSNDFGYDQALAMQIEAHAQVQDWLIAISSSGRSINIRNAVHAAKERGCRVATFSGFAPDNPLRGMGESNYWVDSHNYGVVECAHMAILHALVKPE